MSPEAQRIAIAEACGWTQIGRCTCGQTPRGTSPTGWRGHLPDYLTDLNAMHKAVMTLPPDRRNAYVNHVSDITTTEENDSDPVESDFAFINATAAQRREAFLKTLNLWRDDA